MLRSLGGPASRLLAKYDRRGWQSQDTIWEEEEPFHGSMLQRRRLGDSYTWVIPLDTKDVDPAETPDSVLEYTCWGLSKEIRQDSSRYNTNVRVFTNPSLKYRYVFSDYERDPQGFWLHFAGPRLDRLGWTDMYKVGHSNAGIVMCMAARDYGHSLYAVRSELAREKITLPGYDHEIPGWYAVWQRSPVAVKNPG